MPMVESMMRTGYSNLWMPSRRRNGIAMTRVTSGADQSEGLHEATEAIVHESAVEAEPHAFGMTRHHADQSHADEPHREFGHEIRRFLALDGANDQ